MSPRPRISRLRRLLSVAAAGVLSAWLTAALPGLAAASSVETQEMKAGNLGFTLSQDTAGEFQFALAGLPEGAPATIRVPSAALTPLPGTPEHADLGPEGQTGFVLPANGVVGGNSWRVSIVRQDGHSEGNFLRLGAVVAPPGGTYTGYSPAWFPSFAQTPLDAPQDQMNPQLDGLGLKGVLGTGRQADGEPQGDSLRIVLTDERFQQRFTAAGMYCVTYQMEYRRQEGAAPHTLELTQRYAVGDDIAIDAACGAAPPVTLSGRLWNDANRNQAIDDGEDGIAGVEMIVRGPDHLAVTDEDGEAILATTGADGSYAFESLPPLADPSQRYRVELGRGLEGLPTSGLLHTTAAVRATTEDVSVPGARQTGLDFGFSPRDEDDPKRVLFRGHADLLYPQIDTAADGGKSLRLRAKADELQPKVNDWDDLIVFVGDHEQTRIADGYAFLGQPGQQVWNSGRAGGEPWIGMSSEDRTLYDEIGGHRTPGAMLMFRLDAVTGHDGGEAPGDVVLWGGSSAAEPRLLFSTREGLPRSRPYDIENHTHFNWTFTAPGVYCLAFGVDARIPPGQALADRRQLTVVVGNDTNPNTVESCESRNDYPQAPGPRRSFLANDDGAPVVLSRPAEFQAEHPRVLIEEADGDLVASMLHDRRDPSGRLTSTAVDDVILHGGFQPNGRLYNIGTLGLDASEKLSAGDIAWRVTGVRGPGDLYSDTPAPPTDQFFDTAQGRDELTVWSGGSRLGQRVLATRPGKYCVDMEWRSTNAAGDLVTDTAVLTLVADGPLDPADVHYDAASQRWVHDGEVWLGRERGALDETCEQRPDSWTRPGDVTPPDDDPDRPAWSVPNGSATHSGATILNNGHVDVASVLDGGAFATRIKDDTAGGAPVFRPVAGTVLQLLPESEMQVPVAERFRFLGVPGARLWQVDQSQRPGLLWPGWSTESIPAAATTGGVNWTLNAVDGPGEFFIYQTEGFGDVIPVLSSTSLRTPYAIPKNTHAHGNWAFTAQGVYCLNFTRSATLTEGDRHVSDTFTLAVAVGETDPRPIDPTNCVGTAASPPAPQQPTPDEQPAPQQPAPDEQPAPQQPMPDEQPAPGPRPAPVVRSVPILPLRATQIVSGARLARLATLRCPTGGLCRVTAPKRVRVRIAGKRYTLTVLAPKTIRAGRHATLRVRLPRAAMVPLRGRKATVTVRVAVVHQGRRTARTVKVAIKANMPARRVVAGRAAGSP